ncbi:uncharacterized protein LOC131298697 [Rhododendron vialii]|uniref:uncharacterized protein LOC131298697 n=1 Tax=Rhododendron vialii TaxID=182163 RepID=UPI00265DF7D9|nr:uncharacterized protein LOC131298697 [Rhododendron vialii]
MEFVSSNSVGASGSLIIMWNTEIFKATNVLTHRSFVLREEVLLNSLPCVLVNIYAPNEGLPHPISDHCPVVLLDDDRDWGPRSFRFLDIWLSNPNCMRIAKETWEEVQINGWAGFIFLQKLKAIKDKLRVWNKEEFGDLNCALQECEAALHQLDVLAEERHLTEEEKTTRCKTRTEFWRLSRLSESLWRQKSRVKWLKLGDKNTRFFQVIANYRFKRNMVGFVKVDGSIIEELGDIKEAAVVYFRSNFKEERRFRTILGGSFNRRLNSDVAMQLEKQFEEGEIVVVLKDCNSLKGPGVDGFNFSFVKKCWSFMKDFCGIP